jgi:hypothetical protein
MRLQAEIAITSQRKSAGTKEVAKEFTTDFLYASAN